MDRGAVIGVRGDADANAQGRSFRVGFESQPDACGHLAGRLGGRLRQEQGELVAAIPSRGVHRAGVLAKHIGHATDGAAAGQVPVTIVDLFEAVEVHQQNRKSAASAPRTLQFSLQRFDEALVIRQSRETVASGAFAYLAKQVHVVD